MKIKSTLLSLTIATTMLATCFAPKLIHAAENPKDISFFVSPSKVFDENVPVGESKDFKFKIGNKVEDSSQNYVLDVTVSAEFESEDGEVIKDNKILSVDKESFKLNPNELTDVILSVNIPKDFNMGNYVAYIDFTKKPVKDIENLNIENTLRVPIYMFVGEYDVYLNTKIDYSTSESKISFFGESPTSFRTNVLDYTKKMFNPFKIYTTAYEILNKPIHNVIINDNQVIDMNNDLYIPLKKVVTSGKLSNTKYVKYDNAHDDKKVKRVVNEGTNLKIILDDNSTIDVECTTNNGLKIQKQLQEIANVSGNISMKEILNLLLVPKNKLYEAAQPVLETTVENKSDIPVTLVGKIETVKNGSEIVFEENYSSSTIAKDSTTIIKNNITKGNLDPGVYRVSASSKVRSVTSNFEHSFEVKNIRTSMLIYSLGIVLIAYLIAIVAIILIIKFLRKKKSKSEEIADDDTTFNNNEPYDEI